MTQTEYEQKRHDCWIMFKTETMFTIDEDAFKSAFDSAYALGKQETKQEITISGWVARDLDGNLFMYRTKPVREETLQVWIGGFADFDLRNNLFPDLTWDDDPIEIELIIKRKKNG